jgi:hypothetical protein
MIYFFAPVFVGWGIALVAARQRLPVAWPALGVALVALAGAEARVHAGRSALSGAARVNMSFTLGNSAGEIAHGLLRASILLCLMAAPYIAWRMQSAFLRSTR